MKVSLTLIKTKLCQTYQKDSQQFVDEVNPINYISHLLYAVKDDKKYDIIWFMGLFYHLRYPLLALDIIAQKTNKMLVFQTLMMPGEPEHEIKEDYNINDRNEMLKSSWPKMSFIEKSLNGDPTNWWAPNSACVEAMLRTCGFKIIARPADEIYICEPDPIKAAVSSDWNQSEYLAAVGKAWKNELDGKMQKF